MRIALAIAALPLAIALALVSPAAATTVPAGFQESMALGGLEAPVAVEFAPGGRVSRLRGAGAVSTGPEQVLIEDWCQQYSSHAGGGMEFGADGYLYLAGGEGASLKFWDYGQDGDPQNDWHPINPCGDPPAGVD